MAKLTIGETYTCNGFDFKIVQRSKCYVTVSDGNVSCKLDIKYAPKISKRGSVTKQSEYVEFGYGNEVMRLVA